MKNFTLTFLFVLLTVIASQSQTLNNPLDEDGYYIVKWNCEEAIWAESNDIEADETFTFAIDVTGTPFEEWLKETPTVEGATRSLAINKWTNYGDVSGGTNRLKQIKENVYGATWNIIQMASTMDVTAATGIDSVVYIYGQVFGYEYTADNPGAEWWMWPEGVEEATVIDPGTGAIFRTLPYTGANTSPELYSDDYEGGLFLSNNAPEQGYTIPCAVTATSSDRIKADVPVVGHEYYTITGVKLAREPRSGIYIHRAIKADGSFESTKIIKPLQ